MSESLPQEQLIVKAEQIEDKIFHLGMTVEISLPFTISSQLMC
jgi:hypothetical protein